MSSEHSPARQRRRGSKTKSGPPALAKPIPVIIPGRDMTINEWCFKRHITRVHFYRMPPEDRPDLVGSGKAQRITPAADERWETQQTLKRRAAR